MPIFTVLYDELELGATLEELGGADELDGSTELLLGATLEELGGADELDGATELLLGRETVMLPH